MLKDHLPDDLNLAKELKPVYTAPSEQAALDAFAEFSAKWERRYPAIVRLWTNAWPEMVPFLAFDVEIRRMDSARRPAGATKTIRSPTSRTSAATST